jgi:hypothetical protein
MCHQDGPKNEEGLELSGTEFVFSVDDVTILGENINNTEVLLEARREV